MTHHHDDAQAGHPRVGHVSPLKTLAGVWAALMVLTVVTVAAAQVNVGDLNIWIALVIAVVKGSLVVLYFMHLKYDSPFNAVVFISALVFVILLIGLTLLDRETYTPDLIPGYAPAMEQQQPPA
ncbi:MAG: cytochrome C oxidase subunit IV family protein [Acidobacteriota bacterium]|nr:MAG: cytochrome C oxidase subunit IV family protein [Acidobacteriota bacterium]